MQTKPEPDNIQKQIAEFEKQNPKIAEAMKIFGMTMAKYQEALDALSLSRVYQSNSTTLDERKRYKYEH